MIDLTALRKACDLATPGPWFVQADGQRVYDIFGPKMAAYDDEPEQEWREVQIVETDGGHYPPRWNDAAFIALARTAVPDLLDRVEELEAGLREAIAIARNLDTDHSPIKARDYIGAKP